MQQMAVYSTNCISTCLWRLYAHCQESRLRFTAYGFQHRLLLVVVLESRLVSCVHCGEDAAGQHPLNPMRLVGLVLIHLSKMYGQSSLMITRAA
jgi:hypothetical protein